MKQALPPVPSGGVPGGPPSGGARLPLPKGLGVSLPLILGIVVLLSAFNILRHHENPYERLAGDVTRALEANNMRPVESDFNALRRPQLEDRGKVGSLSDFVNAEGALKSISEDRAKPDAPVGYHHFTAYFDKGNLSEDLTVDADGKIANFHVRPFEKQ